MFVGQYLYLYLILNIKIIYNIALTESFDNQSQGIAVFGPNLAVTTHIRQSPAFTCSVLTSTSDSL